MKTHLPKVNLDQRKWHVIDANGAALGRLAVQVANILRGKDTPVYTPHMDAGGFVVVINAEKIVLTGKKETDKKFMTYSGWKGGEKYRSVEQLRASHPERLITHAVKGMVPKNRLGRVLLTKLLSLIHISEPTRLLSISYAVFCLKKKKKKNNMT